MTLEEIYEAVYQDFQKSFTLRPNAPPVPRPVLHLKDRATDIWLTEKVDQWDSLTELQRVAFFAVASVGYGLKKRHTDEILAMTSVAIGQRVVPRERLN